MNSLSNDLADNNVYVEDRFVELLLSRDIQDLAQTYASCQ